MRSSIAAVEARLDAFFGRWTRFCAFDPSFPPSYDNHLRAVEPGRPWRWRREWIEGQCQRDQPRYGRILFIALFFGVWAEIIFFFSLRYALEGEDGFPALLVFLFIALPLSFVVIDLFVRLATGVYRELRYGRPRFVLQSNPAVIGGTLLGEVRPPFPLAPGSKVEVTLSYFHWVRFGADEGGYQRDTVLEKRVEAELCTSAGVQVLPIEIAIPTSGVPSHLCRMAWVPDYNEETRNFVHWELSVFSKQPGYDYYSTFIVPVFSETQVS